MLKSFNLFGTRFVNETDTLRRIEQARKDFRKEIDHKNTEILKLKAANAAHKAFEVAQRPFIDLNVGDPTPSDSEARKLYVATVAQFFREYFNQKIYVMISNVREQLEKIDGITHAGGRTSQMDNFLKGTINAFWLMHDWGINMTNEEAAFNRELTEDERETLIELVTP